jgi:hypothetical protein
MRNLVYVALAGALACADPSPIASPPAAVPTVTAAPPSSAPPSSATAPRSTSQAPSTALPRVDCSGWPTDRNPLVDARSVSVRGAFRPTRLTNPRWVPPLPGALDVVVIDGNVSVSRGDQRTTVATWQAARALGGGAHVVPDGSACVVFALSTELASLETALTSKIKVDTSAPVERIDLARAPELTWSGGRASARLGFEGPGAALSVLSMTGDLEVAAHVHDTSDEILLSIAGAKWLHRASAPGEGDVVPENGVLLEPGSSAHVRAGVRHAAVKFAGEGGDGRFFALQLYTPGGPEQRFRALAEEASAKAAPR